MLKKLLDLRVILIVLLIVSWVVVGIFFFKFKGDTEAQLAAKDTQIADLETSLSEIGELVPAYVVASDVPSGKQVEESDVTEIDVPLSMSDNLVTDYEELIGKYFKLGMPAGTVITNNAIYEEIITPDMRYYDVLVDVVPIGLQAGSFVDIRIKYGTGTDTIGISHRQVAQVNGNCLKLILTEEDIHMFSSMLVDNIVFNTKFAVNKDINNDGEINSDDAIENIGSYIYAVEYVEGGVQNKADSFYSPSAIVQAILNGDPNMGELAVSPEDLILKRSLNLLGIYDTNNDIDIYAKNIRDTMTDAIKEGQKVYDKRVEEELERAKEEG